MKPVVYIDMLFLLNFLMDSVTLYASSLFLRKPLGIGRLALSAGISALYSAVMFFPVLSFMYSLLFKIIFLFLIAWLAFPAKGLKALLKNAAVFFAVNTVFGGVSFALIFATDFGTTVGAVVSNGEVYLDFGFGILAISTILAYGTVYIISYIKKQKAKNEKLTADITLQMGERTITLTALCDTGCTLCEPITGAPAVIISPDAAKKIVPQEFPDGEFADRYRVLPYCTVDNPSGILHGFFPDRLVIDGNEISRSVVGIAAANLTEFPAIFNPELIENNKNGKEVNINNETEAFV